MQVRKRIVSHALSGKLSNESEMPSWTSNRNRNRIDAQADEMNQNRNGTKNAEKFHETLSNWDLSNPKPCSGSVFIM